MIHFDDPKWDGLEGGYKTPYDPRPALRRLERGEDVWDELWENLHHQGDVGVASYAAVPHLARIENLMREPNWNFYALVSTIEIERHRKTNPVLPDWLKEDYDQAWKDLARFAIVDLLNAIDSQTTKCILGALAIASGNLKLGAVISYSDDSQIDEILEENLGWLEVYREESL